MGVDVVADRQLLRGNDALGLVADVEEHFVRVDLHDFTGDDVAVVEGDDRGVDRVGERHAPEIVVGDDLRLFFDLLLHDFRGINLGGRGFRNCGGGGRGGRIRLLVQHFVPYRGYRRRAGR